MQVFKVKGQNILDFFFCFQAVVKNNYIATLRVIEKRSKTFIFIKFYIEIAT